MKERVEIGFEKDINAKEMRYRYHKSGNPLKEALMIQDLMRDRTQKGVATILSISQGQISRRLRLLSLLPELQKMLLEDTLRPSTAYALSKLPADTQKEFLSHDRITLKDAEAAKREQTISKELMEHLTTEPQTKPSKTSTRIALRIQALESAVTALKQHLALEQWQYTDEQLGTIQSTSQCIRNLVKRKLET